MGEVYRATDSRLKRDIAIKVLPDAFSLDAESIARFQREAEVLASPNHPHIAAIYDLGSLEGSRFLILEFVEGDTRADRIARGAIPLNEALSIASQIAEALEAAHEKGVIQRDLRPANIKLTIDGNVKVLVAQDGQRFLINAEEISTAPLTVILNRRANDNAHQEARRGVSARKSSDNFPFSHPFSQRRSLWDVV